MAMVLILAGWFTLATRKSHGTGEAGSRPLGDGPAASAEAVGGAQPELEHSRTPLSESQRDNAVDQDLKSLVEETQEIDGGVHALNDFFPIHEATIAQMVAEIGRTNRELVTEDMSRELDAVLVRSVLAYKHGDASGIFADRTRAPYRVLPEATEWQLDMLRSSETFLKEKYGNEFRIPSDPVEIMRLVIDTRYYGTSGSGFKNLYNQLSVKGSSIRFHQSTALPVSFQDHFRVMLNGGLIPKGLLSYTPSIEYVNSPAKVLEKDGKLVYVDIRLAASDSDMKKYSRMKRLYWSQEDHTWLYMDMCSFYTGKRRADEFF